MLGTWVPLVWISGRISEVDPDRLSHGLGTVLDLVDGDRGLDEAAEEKMQ
jgi:hypothetical protein